MGLIMIRVFIKVVLSEVYEKLHEKDFIVEVPEGSTINDVINEFERRYGVKISGIGTDEVAILHNGHYPMKYLNEEVKNNDQITIRPGISGG